MKVYGDMRSGNCLKVKYVADKLGITHEWQEVDVLSGYTRTPEFLALNPAGQIPTVIFGEGQVLAQSNAIMRYLAKGSALIPTDTWQQAQMDQWLFWEQYSHEPTIAVARFIRAIKNLPADQVPPGLMDRGNAALDVMEKHLTERNWFVGDACTLADIALLAYTQFAEEGGFSLENRPNITNWIARVRAELAA
ncbi:glutathione S-transferase family protein [Kordiimonas gwangyangensis]|uniref:glutathione S-transferase family protein n=1 Tax=Kordiimonas gwangyangensis TaxID=288022 RepID=UPI00036F389A|nr:glutathione S-transferase family protein [Kordiimonas gwangyangensis]